MITLLLIQKIASLFLIMGVGFLLVRTKLVESGQSAVLSKVMIYAVCPCAVISAFQVDLTSDVLHGFALAMAAGFAMQFLQMAVVRLIARPLRLSGLEKMASVYSNSFNLILPLVGFCLGEEWNIYALAYMSVQTLFMWTHGKALIEGTAHFEIKKLLLDINLIAIVVGFIMFVTGIRLVGTLEVFASDLGKLLGPIAMLIAGMIVGGMTLPQVVGNRRVWLITFIRLIGLPAVVCLALKAVVGFIPLPDAQNILLITLLAAVTPSASMSVIMSQVYGTEAPYASAINVVTTLACILTMPIWVYVYLL